jgi:ABC-2 type transport system ATP-binding protein
LACLAQWSRKIIIDAHTCHLQDADSGTVTLGDIDVLNNKEAVRKVLGYLPQEFGVYPRTSAIDLLDHLALLKGFNNTAERKEMVLNLLNMVNLYDHSKKAVSSYSGGMRQSGLVWPNALLDRPNLW